MTATLLDRVKNAPIVDAALGLRAPDRLAIVVLMSSIYFFQVWGYVQLEPGLGGSNPANLLALTMIALSILGVIASRVTFVLLANCAVYLGSYLYNSPIASNNQAMCAYFAATVLAAALAIAIQKRWKLSEISREDLFLAIAGPGRWILAIMYFYGVYHKINADFLNPQVSCGVVLYKALAMHAERVAPFLHVKEWIVGHYTAIWATFIIETAAMILLFSNRYKKIGFIIGVPFHIIIGWSGYGYYMDFSTIVMVTYALFLPKAAPENMLAWAARTVGGEQRALMIGRAFIIGMMALTLFLIGVWQDWRFFSPQWIKFVPIFTVYGLLFYAFTVFFTPWKVADNLHPFKFSPQWTAIVPILFFINGASPYLGLKTESSIAMFSNLHTEGGVTNHYLTGVLPFGAKYQEDIVKVVTTSDERIFSGFDPRSGHRGLGDNVGFVRYDFDRMLAKNPDIKVTFMYKGQLRTNDATWENSYLKSSWFEKYFLLFKPVDFERPKICTH